MRDLMRPFTLSLGVVDSSSASSEGGDSLVGVMLPSLSLSPPPSPPRPEKEEEQRQEIVDEN